MGGIEERYTPDGNWWWDGHKWVRVHQESEAAQGGGRPSRWLWLAIAAGVLVAGAGAVAALTLLDPGSPNAPAAQATPTAAVAVAAHPASPTVAPGVLVDTAGTGIGTTPDFDAPAHWKLRYTYDCSQIPAGTQGSLQVLVYQDDLPVDVAVNEVGSGGGATIDVARPGHLHLEVNSECRWRVTATTAAS